MPPDSATVMLSDLFMSPSKFEAVALQTLFDVLIMKPTLDWLVTIAPAPSDHVSPILNFECYLLKWKEYHCRAAVA